MPDRAIFVGPVQDNELHKHHALQLVASSTPFRLSIGQGEVREERFVLIDSNVPHKVQGDSPHQFLVLIDRESVLSDALRASLPPGIGFVSFQPVDDLPVPPETCGDARRESDRLARSVVQPMGVLISDQSLDHRIQAACRFITEQEDFKTSLGAVAAHIGLSEGRTTHLFKEQIGVPIRRFVMWLRIRRAIAEAAATGSLTDASHSAGFADQAHFTRTFRDMFGLSPKQILARKGAVDFNLCFQE